MLASQLEEQVRILIIAVVLKFETPQPNSWLAGLGQNRRSVGEGGR
jgi:hypothetical protein